MTPGKMERRARTSRPSWAYHGRAALAAARARDRGGGRQGRPQDPRGAADLGRRRQERREDDRRDDEVDQQAKQANAKVGTETFKGLTLHIIQPPKDGDKPNPPLIWTNAGTVFHIATDLDALKDLISHAEGRTTRWPRSRPSPRPRPSSATRRSPGSSTSTRRSSCWSRPARRRRAAAAARTSRRCSRSPGSTA